jgi:hypothetical protein
MLLHEKFGVEANLISYYCPFNPWLVCPACLLRMQPRLWNDLKTTLAGELGCESNLTAIRLSSALGKDQISVTMDKITILMTIHYEF